MGSEMCIRDSTSPFQRKFQHKHTIPTESLLRLLRMSSSVLGILDFMIISDTATTATPASDLQDLVTSSFQRIFDTFICSASLLRCSFQQFFRVSLSPEITYTEKGLSRSSSLLNSAVSFQFYFVNCASVIFFIEPSRNRPFPLVDFVFPTADHVAIPRRVFSFKVGHFHVHTQST